MSRESKILTAVLIVVIGGMIALFAYANRDTSSGPKPVGDKTKITRDNSHKTGSGPVELVEFGDYQCPACGAAFPNVNQLLAEYDGKITFYFRNFPLIQVHKNAMVAANAAEAAADQGKFWEYHHKLYETQKDWSELTDPVDKFVEYAKGLGLDTGKFKDAVVNEQFKNIIEQDMADGNALNINATPTFFLNGQQVTGGYTYENLKKNVDAALGTSAASPAASASPAQ